MTVSSSEIADALRWLWVVLGLVWIGYAWLHRIEYRRTVLVLVGLFALDWVLHAFASFTEQPDSGVPSDFPLYSLFMLGSAIAGLAAACLYGRWRGVQVSTVLLAALVCVIVGGIGGRLYQVWMHWDYYAENRDMIAELTQGGFGMRGALGFGILGLILFALVTRISFWTLADVVVVGLALAQSIGWYGAAVTHTHYGLALDTALVDGGVFAPLAQFLRGIGYNVAQDLPDAYNIVALRVPVQLLTSLFYGLLFVALLGTARAPSTKAGLLFVIYLIAASAAGFLFGFWRGDATLAWNGLRVDQWMDGLLLLVGIALAIEYKRSGLHHGRTPDRANGRMLQHA